MCFTRFIFWIFFIFFLSFILFFNFTILYWFCHISTWIRHRYTRAPHPEPSSSLLVPSLWVIPVHKPQASSIVHQTWTGDPFHIWYYTCFNAILPNHPTPSLSHRVQKTIPYISVSFAVSYTGLPKPLTVWITVNCGKFWKRWEHKITWPAFWEICMQVRKQQLELAMEQQTGSK